MDPFDFQSGDLDLHVFIRKGAGGEQEGSGLPKACFTGLAARENGLLCQRSYLP